MRLIRNSYFSNRRYAVQLCIAEQTEYDHFLKIGCIEN